MTEKIMEGIYRIEAPLPGNPLRSINSYLILGSDRNLLIDTGFSHQACRNAIVEGFRQIGAQISDTDIFLTHLHADHSGLAAELAGNGGKIYCSEQDGSIVNLLASQEYWDEMDVVFSRHGMPDMEEDPVKGIHPGKLFGGKERIDFSFVKDGDIIRLGKYCLRCVLTPGHTPGHMCLYDEQEQLLFSGDHILGDITPVISVERGMERPLSLYLDSLERIGRLEIKTILTGHRGSIQKPYQRIEQLKKHHESRAKEIVKILTAAESSMNAYEIAAEMTWKMPKEKWSEISRQQRWFATGEAMAHLLYLQEKGAVSCVLKDNLFRFFIEKTEGPGDAL